MESPNSPQYVWVPPDQVDGRLDTRPFKPWVIERVRRCHSFKSGTVRLGDPGVCSLLSRGAGGGQESENNVAVLKAKEITGYGFAKPELFLSDCPAAKLLRPDDVVLTSSGIGTIGRTDLIDDISLPPESPHTVDNHVTIIRLKRGQLRPGYLAAFLNSAYGKAWSEWGTTGSTRLLELPPSMVRAFAIPRPDIKVQEHIAGQLRLAERCRAAASREHEKLGTELATLYEGCPYDALSSLTTIVAPAEIDGSRLDAWYHQRHFITLTEWLRRNPAFVELGKVASLSSDRWSPGAHGQSTFRYIEISNVDSLTGHVSHSEVPVENAPSRARKLLRGFDVLASTVRPNRGAVGLVPDSLDGAVATTGFAVVRAVSKTDAFFLLAVLRHPASTAQLMRCNTGSAYPAIEESVLPQIWIPGAKPGTRKSLGARELRRTTLLQTAVDLVDQAKADVEALIEGTLDVQAILAGTLKPPTADDIPELAEDDA